MSRRTVLRLTALAAAAAPTLGQLASAPPVHAQAASSVTLTQSLVDSNKLIEGVAYIYLEDAEGLDRCPADWRQASAGSVLIEEEMLCHACNSG